MKLNLTTVGCILLGFATAFPGQPGEGGGEKSCSSCPTEDKCGKEPYSHCYWKPHYKCECVQYGPGNDCKNIDDKYKCNSHGNPHGYKEERGGKDGDTTPKCKWECKHSKGECKAH
ncbi:hypothetical protein FNYG_10510 [Fusarium nygamai]|uniref:EGF-like domain-containing protein n=1 Tax=Gibberella nygamai TaxID=42673 RepID=A0A2K0W1R4_GIBNY|nr:hypothetical protein FNYG_10510 [Fusarium nygamai]